jgi:hypothetical protein
MPRYRPPTIKDQGGLSAYLPSIGVDYAEFKRLKDTPGITKRAMASLLSKGREKPFRTSTILNWWREDDRERKGTTNG